MILKIESEVMAKPFAKRFCDSPYLVAQNDKRLSFTI